MDYELRLVVEKVSVGSQEVVKRDTSKVYDVAAPESMLDLGVRHEEQISLLGKVQNAVIAEQAKLLDPVLQIRAIITSKKWENRWQGAVLSALSKAA